MAEILQPYSVSQFNRFPDLQQATTNFHSKDGLRFVGDVFGPLVLKYGLEDQLGITILHRHFALQEPEKIVEFNNISLPWKNQADDDSHSGGMILPNAWLLDHDKLMPYEFFFSPFNQEKSVDLTQDKVRAFLDDFVKAAKHSKLDGVVALRMFPYVGYEGGLEFSEGRANIVLKPGQVSSEPSLTASFPLLPAQSPKLTFSLQFKLEPQATEVTWYFEPGWKDQKNYCHCTAYFKDHFHTVEQTMAAATSGIPATLR